MNQSSIITPTNSNQSCDKKRDSPVTTPVRLSQNIIPQSNSNETSFTINIITKDATTKAWLEDKLGGKGTVVIA